mmetsp:Transcript_3204/g.10384  ORF Transcript_3204/g.10384 Transcript_3204/m.10384 type:complete len:272 (-) Transcript_3204:308-1123(-)
MSSASCCAETPFSQGACAPLRCSAAAASQAKVPVASFGRSTFTLWWARRLWAGTEYSRMMVLQANLRPNRLCTISSGLHVTTPARVWIVMLPWASESTPAIFAAAVATILLPLAVHAFTEPVCAPFEAVVAPSLSPVAANAAREPFSAGLWASTSRGLCSGLGGCSNLDLSSAMSSDHFSLWVLGGVGRRSIGVLAETFRKVFLSKSCSLSTAPESSASQSMARGPSDLAANRSSKVESCCWKFGFISISSWRDLRNSSAFFMLHLYRFIR